MKKLICFSMALMLLLLLLCACAGEKDPSGAGTTAPGTAPTTASTTIPSSGPAQLTEEEKFKKLLTEEYWYYRALGCTFEKPEDISLEYYLYSGIHHQDRQDPNSFTDDEKAFLNGKWAGMYGENPWASAAKMPKSKINEALTILGVTVEKVEIPESWVYYDKTDSYYVWRRDAFGVSNMTVTKVEKDASGTVAVYWETKAMHHNTATGERWPDGVKMIMTLKEKSDGTYLVVSNVPQK